MKKSTSHIIEYILPPLAAGLIFTIVLALNGLFPFGKETIDYYDMAQWSDLFYYHNYDELRGAKSLIFDWYLNLGRVIPGLNEPSLFDLLFYFIPRDRLLECMSFLMLIKIMVCAFTMNIFIRYVNEDLPYIFRMMISAGYGMCGFIIVNYTVPMWLDMAALVPLVLMFSQKALKTGKFAGLSVTIFLLMIDDYYFTIQTLMFVFMIGGAYIICDRFKAGRSEERSRSYILRFGLGVAFGLALSAFSWIPDIVSGMSSARFGNGTDGGIVATYVSILKNVTPAYMSRWFSLLSLAVPGALTAIGIINNVRKKRAASTVFCFACIFMTVSQIFLESIHLLLHFGSYVDYPVRNGFMIYCVVAAVAAGLYPGDKDTDMAGGRQAVITAACGTVALIAGVALFVRWYKGYEGIDDHTVLLVTMGIMALFALIHIVIITVKDGRFRNLCVFLWAAELVIFGVIMIGKPIYDSGYGNDPEQEGEYIRITDQLVSGFGGELKTGEDAATRRMKNPDTSLNANYGTVMKRETLSGWTNLATSAQISGAISLGYSNQFTRILDSGGNIFSDTILHITDIISHIELDDKLYEKVAAKKVVSDHMTGEECEYGLYKNRFEMPFAIPLTDVSALGRSSDSVAFFNSYSAAMGAKDMIASKVDVMPVTEENNGHIVYEYHIPVSGSKTLYFAGQCTDCEYYNTRIEVNDKAVSVPSIKENDNVLFPAHFNNNTVELGSFDNADVDVRIDMDVSDADTKYDFIIYAIDRDVLQKLCDLMPGDESVVSKRSGLEITMTNTDGRYEGVLVPVPFSNGWTAKVNGTEREVTGVNGLFMYVPVDKGENSISMTYFPPFMKAGMVIAAVALVCFVILMVRDKKSDPVNTAADRVLGPVYAVAFLAVFLAIYVVPIVYALFAKGA